MNVCDEQFGLPLVEAVACGDERIIDTLIERGAQVDAIDNEQKNALGEAASRGHEKIVRKLLKHHADVNSGAKPSNSITSVSYQQRQEDVIRTLVKNGVDVGRQFDQYYRENLLDSTCHWGHEAIFRLLIEHIDNNLLHLDNDLLGASFLLASMDTERSSKLF